MKYILIVTWLLLPVAGTYAEEAKRPNLLIILADDLGYGDVQCYNPERGKIPTPGIDQLAAQGRRFTDGHSSSAVCSPSRYSLLTGRYHWRTHLQKGIVGNFGPPLIAPDRMTLGTLAQKQGYHTAAIGKWHLGWDWQITQEQQKFLGAAKPVGHDDEAGSPSPTATPAHLTAWREIFSQPILGGPVTRGFDTYFGTDVPNWPPYCFIENDRTLGIPGEYLADAQMGNGLASRQGPALRNWKLVDILPTLGQRAADFIRQQAPKPEPFLLFLPLTSPHTPLAVTEPWEGKSGLNRYADFVMQTDATIAHVLNALEESGEADNTLVIFTSDNGCASYIGAKVLEAKGHYPSGRLRGYKFDAWEGGHRVPFIVRWPGVVTPGSVCRQLVAQVDVFATLAEVLGVKLPDNAGEDSFSLLPLLKNRDATVRENAVSASSEGIPALRLGSWKYIAGPVPGNPSQPVQLYDLAKDLGETRNLAASEPAKVAEMKIMLERLITEGRSTPGVKQRNDVKVVRFPIERQSRQTTQ